MYLPWKKVSLWRQTVDPSGTVVTVVDERLVTLTLYAVGGQKWHAIDAEGRKYQTLADDPNCWVCDDEDASHRFVDAVIEYNRLMEVNARRNTADLSPIVRVDTCGVGIIPKGDVVYCFTHYQFRSAHENCKACTRESMYEEMH